VLSIFRIGLAALRIANTARSVIYPLSHVFVRAEIRTGTPDTRKVYGTILQVKMI